MFWGLLRASLPGFWRHLTQPCAPKLLSLSVISPWMNDDSWKQASLSINSGGLGIRSATSLHHQHSLPLLQILLLFPPLYYLSTFWPLWFLSMKMLSRFGVCFSHANPPSGSCILQMLGPEPTPRSPMKMSLVRGWLLLRSCLSSWPVWEGIMKPFKLLLECVLLGSCLSEPLSCKNCRRMVWLTCPQLFEESRTQSTSFRA